MNAQPIEQAGLYLVTQEGEIVSREPKLSEALQTIERLELELQDVERERRTQRAHIKRLYAELARDRASYERRDEVESIHREWATVCGHGNSRLTDDRFDAVRRLLEVTKPKAYPREAFSAAFAGAAFDPFITRRKNGTEHRHTDLELICRDGAHFESFIKRAPRGGMINGTNRAGSAGGAPAPTPREAP